MPSCRFDRFALSFLRSHFKSTMRAAVFAPARPIALTTLRTVLRARRWEVVETSKSEELLELVHGVRPDLVVIIGTALDSSVILDCADRVRSVDRNARIFIVSSACSFDVAIGAMRRGVNDVLSERCSEQEVERL
jgi:ActR/RegA family two-component response regulator